jgi:hypothetical protein
VNTEDSLKSEEEAYFYGQQNSEFTPRHQSSSSGGEVQSKEQVDNKVFLIVSDSQSTIVLVDLISLRVVFASKSVRRQEASLVSCVGVANDSQLEKYKKHIREIRMHRMSQLTRGDIEISRLCIVAMFESGDFGLYRASEGETHEIVHGFLKVEYASAIRKRKAKLKLRRTIWNEPSANDAVEFEDSNMYSMARVENLNGYSGIVISGPRPVFISASAGLPFAVPLTFSELPCNYIIT